MGIESKITSKGQTTIPAEIRERLGLQTGDRIAFIEMEQGFLIMPRNRPVSTLFGSLALTGPLVRFTDEAAESHLPRLFAAADAISKILGSETQPVRS